jgi:capsid protein
MTFLSETAVPAETAAVAYMRRQARDTKNYMAAQKAAFQLIRGNIVKEMAIISAVAQHIDIVVANLDAAITTPGVGQAAKDSTRNPDYDVAAEYAPWRAAMIQLRADLNVFLPQSPITNPQASALAADMDAINATIS